MKVRIHLPDNVDPKSVVDAFDPTKSKITASVQYSGTTQSFVIPMTSQNQIMTPDSKYTSIAFETSGTKPTTNAAAYQHTLQPYSASQQLNTIP